MTLRSLTLHVLASVLAVTFMVKGAPSRASVAPSPSATQTASASAGNAASPHTPPVIASGGRTGLPATPAASGDVSGVVAADAKCKSEIQPSFWRDVVKQAIGGAFAIFFVYIFVHRHQQNAERQKLMHELAQDFEKINTTDSVTSLRIEGFDPDMKYKFNVALTRHIPWSVADEIDHQFETGERVVIFCRDRSGRVSTTVLHETLFWFRRVWRASEHNLLPLLREEDLVQLWRHALVFVTDFRYTFLERYFGSDDVVAIRVVAKSILEYSRRRKLLAPIKYVTGSNESGEMRLDPAFSKTLSVKLRNYLLEQFQRSQ